MPNDTSAAAPPAGAAASPGLRGRACKACSTAKTKCVPSNNSSPKCQRCQRIGKSCEHGAAAPRRKSDNHARVAKLEEKLASLVKLLNNASTRRAAAVAAPVEQLSAVPTPQPSSCSTPAMDDEVQNLESQNARPVGDMSGKTVPQKSNEQNFEQANISLDRFRTMTEYFPFVVIPPTVDARTLLRERPFLYRTIMAAAEQNPNDQRDQVRDIVQYLALHMLQLGEKNLDTLLGVLVHIAWCHFHIHALPRITSLLHEALALLFDLRLNRATSRNPKVLVFDERLVGKSDRTLEERRAALGCFFVVSGAASYFQNIEPLRWSSYLEDCLGELQKFNEYDTDTSLIRCVRIQRMAERINSNNSFDGTDQFSGWKLYPPTLYIRALQVELQALKNDLQAEFPQNSRLLAHYYSVEMTLFEIGLSKARLPSAAHASDFQRLEILYACLESVGNFFETFLEIPPASYWTLSLIHFCQLAYSLSLLQRLSVFEDPTWDLHYVAEKLSFLAIVDQISIRMVEALRYGGTEPSTASESVNVLSRAVGKLRKLSAMFRAQQLASTQQPGPDQMGNLLDAGDIMNLDNIWEQDWFDVMGGGNWG